MMPEAFDADKYERTLKQEGREDEIEIGKEIGTKRFITF